jgi:hypothetical protein
MIEKYFQNLDDNFPRGSVLYMRELEKSREFSTINNVEGELVFMEGVKRLQFHHMYQNISVFLFNNRILNFGNDVEVIQYLQEVEEFLTNEEKILNDDDYLSRRDFSRKLYSKIHTRHPEEASKMMHFTNKVLEDVASKNSNIIEIDTDTIFYEGNIDISFIPIKNTIDELKYFIPIRRKQSILVTQKFEVIFRGLGGLAKSKNANDRRKHAKFMEDVYSKLRDDKLNYIIGEF